DQGTRRALRGASRSDAVTFERLDNGVRIEIIHAHAEMVDAGAARSGVRAAGEHKKLNAITQAHHGRRRSLISLNPQTEKVLVKLLRARWIGHGVRTVTPAANGQQP